MTITMTLNTILELTAAVLGLVGLIAALWALRAVRTSRARCLAVESSLSEVRRELEQVASVSIKTGRWLQRVEHEYSGVAGRVEQVELRGGVQSFDRAIDYARRGADTSKLTQQFGLSLGEADLVARLHGRKKTA
jgi:hypothetical protein